MEENHILRDLRVLTEEFIPSHMLHRDSQLQVIRDTVEPATRGQQPRNAFLYGPPGTGKTCLALYVAEELKKAAPVLVAYVNCWEDSTRFGILYSILRGLGAFVHRKGIPTDELLERFRHTAKSKRCLIILDEIDQLEEDTVLYDLLEANTGIIMISNVESALAQVDPRVRSRLASAEVVPFPRYGRRELLDILSDRASLALYPGTIKREQLERAAELAGGDMRAALGVLSLAAQKAEQKDLPHIPDAFLDTSLPVLHAQDLQREREHLPPYQQAILDALRGGKMPAGELLEKVQDAVKRQGLDDLQERTFRKHMERLSRLQLVRTEGEGRWRMYESTT